jgi:hypothetical protein
MGKTVEIKWTDKKVFHVSVDMFSVDILFVCNAKEKRAKKFLKKMCGENYKRFPKESLEGWNDAVTLGRMIAFSGGFVVLLKNKDGNFRNFVATAVHEITHVSHYLLRDRRIPLNEDTEEVYTYLTEYITREVLLKLYE